MAHDTHTALIAELLGDVGKLHDEIKALPASLQDALAGPHQAAARLEATSVHLETVLQQMIAGADRVAEAVIREAADKTLPGGPAIIDLTTVRRGVQAAIEEPIGKLQSQLTAIAKGQDQMSARAGMGWALFALCIAGGVVGGLLAGALALYLR